MAFAATWIDLEMVILSEVRQTSYDMTFMWSLNSNTNKYSKVVLPIPNDKYQRFVHMCDFLASRNYLNVKFEKLDII